MMQRLYAVSFAILPALLSIGAQATRPEPFARPALHLRLHWFWPNYTERQAQGAGMILRGEPLEIDIAVINRADGPRAKVESDWFDRVSLTVRMGRQFDERSVAPTSITCSAPPVVIQEEDVHDAGDHLLLGRDGYRYVRCRANLDILKLSAGVYTLRAEWGPKANVAAYQDRFRSATPHFLEFELRDIATDADRLDFYLNMANRAYHDRQRPAEALQLIRQALSQDPVSARALILRAHIQAAQGACEKADADVRHAAHVIANGLDGLNRDLAALDPKGKQELAAKWLQRAHAGACQQRVR